MSQSDESYQIKELVSGTFKFPDSPQNNKLMHLKDVHKWVLKIRHTFRRYSDFYMFLYATAGYIDTNVELQPRKLRESQVKRERNHAKPEPLSDGEESPDEKHDGEGEENDADVPEGLKRELREFGNITTYKDLGKFMKLTKFSDKILADKALLEIVARSCAPRQRSLKPMNR